MSDDREYLLYAYQGNAAAVDLVLRIAEISHIWDDLVDKDKPVSDAQINRAFGIALLELPKNPFYQAHCLDLLPVMTTGTLNWLTANKYEKTQDKEAHALAHVLRYGIADIALFIAHVLRLSPLAGHTGGVSDQSLRPTTGVLPVHVFENGPESIEHPMYIRRFLESHSWSAPESYAAYREAMIAFVGSTTH